MIAGIAGRNDWPLQCSGDDELTLWVGGKSGNYQLFFTWMQELEIFHLACVFEMKIPRLRRSEVQKLDRTNQRATVVGTFRAMDGGRHNDVP